MAIAMGSIVGLLLVAIGLNKARQHLYLLFRLRRWPDENDVAVRRRELNLRRARWRHVPPSTSVTFAGVVRANDALAAPNSNDLDLTDRDEIEEAELGERLAAALDAAVVQDEPLGAALGDAVAREEALVGASRRTQGTGNRPPQWSRHQRRHARRRRR